MVGAALAAQSMDVFANGIKPR